MIPRESSKFKIILTVLGLIFVFIIYSSPNEYHYTDDTRMRPSLKKKLLNKQDSEEQVYLETARGNVSYDEIEEKIFRPLGYQMVEKSVPIPTLEFVEEQQCEQIFSDWLSIAKSDVQGAEPPRTVPKGHEDEFTMNGYALQHEWYSNDRSSAVPQVWNQIPEWMNTPPIQFVTYGRQGMTIYRSMQHHRLDGMKGFVVGSLSPWVEVCALRSGAKEVLTVEYQNTSIVGTDKVSYIHPFRFAEEWESRVGTFDFAASFSSIEHSGLQRYGDPMDPIGDIREVLKVKCMLKTGGLFFLGLPGGQDQLVYNVHRIYGRIRLTILFSGFELLSVFRNDNSSPHTLTVSDFDGQTGWSGFSFQDTYVLRKLSFLIALSNTITICVT